MGNEPVNSLRGVRPILTIALCTSVKNRTDHLRHTLPFNIGACAAVKQLRRVRFEHCICDYDSNDDVFKWLEIHIPFARLKRVENKPQYNQSNAKNCSHTISDKADYLMNVDADNYVPIEYMIRTIDLIEHGFDLICHKNDPFIIGKNSFMQEESFSGEAGRITVRRSVFEEMGGYDEDFIGWGNDDCDLIARAEAMGYKVAYMPANMLLFKPSIIEHDHELRTQNTTEKDRLVTMDRNIRLALDKYSRGEYVCNMGREIGQ